MGETTSITLHYDRTRLEGIRMDGQIWLRGSQIVTPLGFASEHGMRNLVARYGGEFSSEETRLIMEQTAGGPQHVRWFSLRGARLLGMLARTEPAARFRRWLLDLLEGKVNPGARPSGTLLEAVEGPPRLADDPQVRAAIQRAMQAGVVVSAAFRQARQMHKEARRMAALAGLSARELKLLVERERWQTGRAPAQPSLLSDA
jgi:prophage antirepressor-like protein